MHGEFSVDGKRYIISDPKDAKAMGITSPMALIKM